MIKEYNKMPSDLIFGSEVINQMTKCLQKAYEEAKLKGESKTYPLSEDDFVQWEIIINPDDNR